MSKQAFNPLGGYHVFVAYPETAEAIQVEPGVTWYYFTVPPPESPGSYNFQSSFDAGDTWSTLAGNVAFTGDNQKDHYFTVWVNPLILKPYVWYRFVPYKPPTV
jgi:hypothetical protein